MEDGDGLLEVSGIKKKMLKRKWRHNGLRETQDWKEDKRKVAIVKIASVAVLSHKLTYVFAVHKITLTHEQTKGNHM